MRAGLRPDKLTPGTYRVSLQHDYTRAGCIGRCIETACAATHTDPAQAWSKALEWRRNVSAQIEVTP